jgi:internalin A
MTNDELLALIDQAARDGWTELDLRDQEISELPPEIGRLTSLQKLSIGRKSNRRIEPEDRNPLKTLPSEIVHLIQLCELDLRWNHLTILPPEIGQLTALQRLDLRGNQLTGVPPEIGQLIALQQLYLSRNQLTALPPEIGQLIALQQLYLSRNQLTALPPEIDQLVRLNGLYLSYNQLTAVPARIGQLTNLQQLYLSHNQLTAVPAQIGQLTNLQELYLSHNQLTTLPTALRRLSKLEKLRLYGNPLPIPPELLGNWDNSGNPESILDAYFQASRPLAEAKLLLVGEGSVGKSSLVERLLWNQPPSDQGKTVGVDIHRWEVSSEKLAVKSKKLAGADASESYQHSLQVNVWDFGGQEIYHATHQFFLTHRSLYLIVLESRKDEIANSLDYWLRHVQSFAGDAPIIVVANKSDQHKMILDKRGLQLKYPAIKAIVHTSCVTGAGIDQLRQAIKQALAALPHVNDWIPVTWFAVKEKLAALGKETLHYDSYIELCEAEGISHEAAQRTLARFLHDLGAALNFQGDRRLAGTHVLNPEWVTGGIYQILNAGFLQGRGILCLNDLDRILDRRRYPPEKHAFLLDIMRKFEVCVPYSDGRRYLIPGLLAKAQPPFNWRAGAAPALEYRYAILPASILSRLMVRLHGHIWQGIRWRNGMVLSRDGCRALLVGDTAANRLTIALDGPAPHRRHLVAVIRAELDEIHASFAQLEAEQWVPIPGHPDKAIAYEDLLYYESEQDWTPRYAPVRGRIDVRALLDGIESPAEREVRSLVRRLTAQYSLSELRQLGFDLDADHENLSYATKNDLARELALHCERRGCLAKLKMRMEKERP